MNSRTFKKFLTACVNLYHVITSEEAYSLLYIFHVEISKKEFISTLKEYTDDEMDVPFSVWTTDESKKYIITKKEIENDEITKYLGFRNMLNLYVPKSFEDTLRYADKSYVYDEAVKYFEDFLQTCTYESDEKKNHRMAKKFLFIYLKGFSENENQNNKTMESLIKLAKSYEYTNIDSLAFKSQLKIAAERVRDGVFVGHNYLEAQDLLRLTPPDLLVDEGDAYESTTAAGIRVKEKKPLFTQKELNTIYESLGLDYKMIKDDVIEC